MTRAILRVDLDPPRSVRPLQDANNEVSSPFPSAEESLTALHRAGWSVNCTAFDSERGPVWIVSGYNGENQVLTAALTRDEAWWQACLQARSVGMLGRRTQPVSNN